MRKAFFIKLISKVTTRMLSRDDQALNWLTIESKRGANKYKINRWPLILGRRHHIKEPRDLIFKIFKSKKVPSKMFKNCRVPEKLLILRMISKFIQKVPALPFRNPKLVSDHLKVGTHLRRLVQGYLKRNGFKTFRVN